MEIKTSYIDWDTLCRRFAWERRYSPVQSSELLLAFDSTVVIGVLPPERFKLKNDRLLSFDTTWIQEKTTLEIILRLLRVYSLPRECVYCAVA
jgi:hypothetical protein